MADTTNEWFAGWFDSPYYHLLYRHRDHEEAAAFIDALMQALQPKPDDHILDLACGAGRHSNYLANKGYTVTGLDLSKESIARAKANAADNVSFGVADMRQLDAKAEYDLVLNLFTSFGYFEDFDDNLRVLKGVNRALKPGGQLVLDYLNPTRVQQNLVPVERIKRDDVEFAITRGIENNRVIKRIAIRDKGKFKQHKESVQLISHTDMRKLMHRAGFVVRKIWGNYQLESYDPESSPRMIFLAQKPGN